MNPDESTKRIAELGRQLAQAKVGDYVETKGREGHFMFRGGHINGHPRTHFAGPANSLNEDVLASYACTGRAQAIHDNGEDWDI